jgi:hypothetical protein
MAQKNARHGNRPAGTPASVERNDAEGIVTMQNRQSVTCEVPSLGW